MAGVAAAIGGSAVLGYIGSQNAAKTQANAMAQSAQAMQDQLNYEKEIQAPYQQAGTQALSQMQNPAFQQDFTMADFKTSPGYQFSLQQGQKALDAANAASGNSVSGAALTAASQYNVGMANQEYQQALNNYQNNLTNKFNRLGTIAGMGAGANQQAGNAAMQFGTNMGNLLTSGGNAAAASQIAGMNAIGGGLSGIAGTIAQNNAAAQSMNNLSPGWSNMGMFSGPSPYASSGGTSMSSTGGGGGYLGTNYSFN